MQVGLENWNLFNLQFLCGLFVLEECSHRLVGVFLAQLTYHSILWGTNLLGWGDVGDLGRFWGISNFLGLIM